MPEILLMGGLGNQLFQIAAGLSYSNDDITLVDNLGNPRRNDQNEAEIESFDLPKRVKIQNRSSVNYLSQKLLNYGIRIGAHSANRSLQIMLVQEFSKILKFLSPLSGFGLNLSRGVGFDSRFKMSTSCLNVGYFQSSQFCKDEKVLAEMMSLKIAKPSQTFLELNKKATQTSPIIVHIRLGDYEKEEAFGIPATSYYQNGIQLIDTNGSHHPIWLFSNDPSKAIDLIPKSYHTRIFVVPNKGLSSAETLELMRRGSAYVIANSTFSWWGAMLSHRRSSQVVVPTPWFYSGSFPDSIYPELWIRMPADYGNKKRECGDL